MQDAIRAAKWLIENDSGAYVTDQGPWDLMVEGEIMGISIKLSFVSEGETRKCRSTVTKGDRSSKSAWKEDLSKAIKWTEGYLAVFEKGYCSTKWEKLERKTDNHWMKKGDDSEQDYF